MVEDCIGNRSFRRFQEIKELPIFKAKVINSGFGSPTQFIMQV
jgi:hypothetical protein